MADELPDSFIEKVRAAVKRVGPEKFLLGEVWEDATTKFGFDKRRTYLLGKGLDSVMNYPFKNAVLDFVKGKPAEQAMNEILTICEHYPAPAMDTALNFLSPTIPKAPSPSLRMSPPMAGAGSGRAAAV